MEAHALWVQHRLKVPPVDPADIVMQERARSERYLHFPLSSENIVMVNSIETVKQASIELCCGVDGNRGDAGAVAGGANCFTFVGIDCEWRAVMGRQPSVDPGASILQVIVFTILKGFLLNC